jgi:hypothetical protein
MAEKYYSRIPARLTQVVPLPYGLVGRVFVGEDFSFSVGNEHVTCQPLFVWIHKHGAVGEENDLPGDGGYGVLMISSTRVPLLYSSGRQTSWNPTSPGYVKGSKKSNAEELGNMLKSGLDAIRRERIKRRAVAAHHQKVHMPGAARHLGLQRGHEVSLEITSPHLRSRGLPR